MPARSLFRHVFRHEAREKVSEDALPLRLRQNTAPAPVNDHRNTTVVGKNVRVRNGTFTPAAKTPEPFGLQDIAEETPFDTSSSTEIASLTDSFTSTDLGNSSFSTRELVHATLDEAKVAISSHLDTINMTLALLDALDGFSATISELKKEMLGKKHACEEKVIMLEAVERAVASMEFASELQELDGGPDNRQ